MSPIRKDWEYSERWGMDVRPQDVHWMRRPWCWLFGHADDVRAYQCRRCHLPGGSY